jgi:hypothetical protein
MRAPAEAVGRVVKCPACGERFRVEVPSAPVEELESPPLAPERPATAPAMRQTTAILVVVGVLVVAVIVAIATHLNKQQRQQRPITADEIHRAVELTSLAEEHAKICTEAMAMSPNNRDKHLLDRAIHRATTGTSAVLRHLMFEDRRQQFLVDASADFADYLSRHTDDGSTWGWYAIVLRELGRNDEAAQAESRSSWKADAEARAKAEADAKDKSKADAEAKAKDLAKALAQPKGGR